jgi:serine/threonine-protein kinase
VLDPRGDEDAMSAEFILQGRIGESPKRTTRTWIHRETEGRTLNPASSARGSSTGAFPLPTPLVAEAQRRLMLASAFFAVATAVVVASDFALVYALGWAAPRCGMLTVGVTGGALSALSLAVFALARSPRIARPTFLDLGLLYEIAGAVGIALASFLNDPVAFAHQPNVWLCLWIVLFPLLAPGAPVKAFVASLLSASAGPIVLLAWSRRGVELPGLSQLAQTFLPGYFSVLLALLKSRVLRRLGATVSHAQEKVRELGSYRLVRLLGTGGMGQVWEAEHKRLARPAAVKVVQLEVLGGDDGVVREKLLRRFEHEARATASLHSPHTINVYDFGVTDDGTFYYVMELLSGLDLESLVQRSGPLPPARVVHILKQAADSLAEAHAQGLIHRDIKPANIYLTHLGLEHDFVKVLDFGLATRPRGCYRQDESRLTGANEVVGTPAYMAPEMAAGDPVDARADLYALGCVAYWLLTGTPVFDPEALTPMRLLFEHMKTPPESPSHRLGVKLPEALEALVLRLLEKDPANRPGSALELRTELEALDLDESWTEAHARTWWKNNLPELVSPSLAEAAKATTVARGLVHA